MRYLLFVLGLYGCIAGFFIISFAPVIHVVNRSPDAYYHRNVLNSCVMNIPLKVRLKAGPFKTTEGNAFMSALNQPGGNPRILELSPEEFTSLAVLVGLKYDEITCLRDKIYEPRT